MRTLPLMPTPLAMRRARARRRAALLLVLMATAGMFSPAALVLLPLVAARAWRGHARVAATLALIAGGYGAARSIDLPALAAYPATLAGPWIALLVGAIATSVAWASGRRDLRDLLRAAAALSLLASPWAPSSAPCLSVVLLALAYRRARRPRDLPVAANDNAAGYSPLAFRDAPRVSPPPLRSARPSAFD